MERIWNSYLLLLKMALRKKGLIILFVLSIFYNVFVFYSFFHDENNAGYALKQTAFTVQGIILVAIIIGVQLNKLERENELIDLFQTIHNSMLFKEISKLLFFAILSILYISINYVIYCVFLVIYSIEFSEFYLDALLYFILYWGFSFIIGGIIGFLISMIFKGKIVYIVSLIIWLFISPLNNTILTQISVLLGSEMIFNLINILNIGQSNPNYPYNTFYGFPLEHVQWVKRSCIFLVCLLLVLVVLLFKKVKCRMVLGGIIITSLLLSLTFISLSDPTQELHYDREKDAINKQDFLYYKNKELIINDHTKEAFRIVSYDINLRTKKKLNAVVMIDVENISNNNHSKINMLLYHDFNVKKVKDSNNKPLSFSQKGDTLNIELDKSIQPREISSLILEYEGISSPFFIVNEQAIFLPNHYPWIPFISPINTIMINKFNEVYRLPIQPSNSVSFKLKIDRNDIFSNLKKESKDKWNGVTNNGLYILSGNFNEIMKNGKSILIPRTFENKLNNFDTFESQLNSIVNQIQKDLGLSSMITINRYVFLEHSLAIESPEQQIWLHGDTIFLSPYIVYYITNEDQLIINKNNLVYALVGAITWKREGLILENIMDIRLFNYSSLALHKNF